jgi:hypothetical protein
MILVYIRGKRNQSEGMTESDLISFPCKGAPSKICLAISVTIMVGALNLASPSSALSMDPPSYEKIQMEDQLFKSYSSDEGTRSQEESSKAEKEKAVSFGSARERSSRGVSGHEQYQQSSISLIEMKSLSQLSS